MMLKRASAAMTDFNRALDIEPDNQDALLGRALAFGFLDQHENSQADLERLVKLGTTNASVYAHLATLEAARRPRQALSYLDRAIELDPDDSGLVALRNSLLASARSNLAEGASPVATGKSRRGELQPSNQARRAESTTAADAVQAARNMEEMQAAVARYPILRESGFLTKLLDWAEALPDEVRPAIVQRVHAAHQVAFQMCFDTFMNANAAEGMKNAVAEYQMLAEPEFVSLVQRMLESGSIPAEARDHVATRIQWLEQLRRQ